jgi:hypothetical protein
MTEKFRLDFKQWNERRVDFFGSFENIKDRCVEKDWYFILTENSIRQQEVYQ